MVVDIVVRFALKFVGIVVAYFALLMASSNRLFTGFATCENLNMDHIVGVRFSFGIVVSCRVENEVTRYELFELQVVR